MSGQVIPTNPPMYPFDVYYHLNEAVYMKTENGNSYLQKNLPGFEHVKTDHFGPANIKTWKVVVYKDKTTNNLVAIFRGTDNPANALANIAHQFFEPTSLIQDMTKFVTSVSRKCGRPVVSLSGHSEGGYLACRALDGSGIERVTLNAHKGMAGDNRYNFRLPHDLISKDHISKTERYILIDPKSHKGIQNHSLKYFGAFLAKKWSEIAPGQFADSAY